MAATRANNAHHDERDAEIAATVRMPAKRSRRPVHRATTSTGLRSGTNNSAGTHTLRCSVSIRGTQMDWCFISGHLLPVNYYVGPGQRVQGGVIGVSDGRTPCWYAP